MIMLGRTCGWGDEEEFGTVTRTEGIHYLAQDWVWYRHGVRGCYRDHSKERSCIDNAAGAVILPMLSRPIEITRCYPIGCIVQFVSYTPVHASSSPCSFYPMLHRYAVIIPSSEARRQPSPKICKSTESIPLPTPKRLFRFISTFMIVHVSGWRRIVPAFYTGTGPIAR